MADVPETSNKRKEGPEITLPDPKIRKTEDYETIIKCKEAKINVYLKQIEYMDKTDKQLVEELKKFNSNQRFNNYIEYLNNQNTSNTSNTSIIKLNIPRNILIKMLLVEWQLIPMFNPELAALNNIDIIIKPVDLNVPSALLLTRAPPPKT